MRIQTYNSTMAISVSSYLNKYDIFGKSIPGTILVIGTYFLLPTKISIPLSDTQTQFDLILRIISAFVLGLLIGEGIHTLSRVVEQTFSFIGNISVKTARIFEYRISIVSDKAKEKRVKSEMRSGTGTEDSEPPLSLQLIRYIQITGLRLIEIVFSSPIAVGSWLFHNIYPIFQSHRTLFIFWVRSNFSDDQPPWDIGRDRILAREFDGTFNRSFETDLNKENGVPPRIYELVSSSVSQKESIISQRFQDLYSFSRSMWVVIFILLIWLSLGFLVGGGNLEPWIIANDTFKSIDIFIVTIMSALQILFMYGTGRYKKIYVLYLVADFATIDDIDELDITFS